MTPARSSSAPTGYVLHRMALEPAFAAAVADGLAILAASLATSPSRRSRPTAGTRFSSASKPSPGSPASSSSTAEGFWADPGNGGNRDARSWAIIGYLHGLPEGPSGPPEPARP